MMLCVTKKLRKLPCLLMTDRNSRIWNDRNWVLLVMSLFLVLLFVPNFFLCTWYRHYYFVLLSVVKVRTEMKLRFKVFLLKYLSYVVELFIRFHISLSVLS
jgi:hypothetical protein